MYKNYQNARDNAWRYLIRHKVKSLPVDVFELCRKDKIVTVHIKRVESNGSSWQNITFGHHDR